MPYQSNKIMKVGQVLEDLRKARDELLAEADRISAEGGGEGSARHHAFFRGQAIGLLSAITLVERAACGVIWDGRIDRAVRFWESSSISWQACAEGFGFVEVEVTTEEPPCARIVDIEGDVPLDWWWPGESLKADGSLKRPASQLAVGDLVQWQGYFSINLPKWPACVISGRPVTEDQAAEILIRTDSWTLSSNDPVWEEQVCRTANINWKDMGYRMGPDWDSIDAFRESHRVLDLEYLTNNQIISAYIGGPNGWCSWDGQIEQTDKNIGKWPSVETVYNEWVSIAEAFPYLNLRCQLFSGEQCEEGIKPLIEFVVEGGTVHMKAPTSPMEVVDSEVPFDRFIDPLAERGCSVAVLTHALSIAVRRVDLDCEGKQVDA